MEHTIRKELDDHPEEFKKIGFYFYCLIRIESNLNILIGNCFSTFTVDGQIAVNQTTGLIINRVLLDEKIFPQLENKRIFLQRMIGHLSREAEKKKVPFEAKRWNDFCKSLQEVQETRNKLAHKFFSFPQNGSIHYYNLKKEPFERKEIKLDNEIKKIEAVYEESEKAMTDFLNQALNVFSYNA